MCDRLHVFASVVLVFAGASATLYHDFPLNLLKFGSALVFFSFEAVLGQAIALGINFFRQCGSGLPGSFTSSNVSLVWTAIKRCHPS